MTPGRALFPPFSGETLRLMDRLPALIEKVFPLPGRFRSSLKHDVAELSRLLTADRKERSNSYLGRPAALSAYLRYFLPWNIYRLCRLFTGLPLDLKPGSAVNDLGAGPLTLAASLWISRPDLRAIPLEFRCVDRTAAVLEAGKKFFTSLAAEAGCPWTIKTIRGEIGRNGGLSAEIRGKPAALSAAVNVYNELFWNFSPHDKESLKSFAEQQARLLSSLTEKSGSVLVVEPGIPRSGEFISLLRSSLIKEGRLPLSPCVHSGSCPLPGGRNAGSRGAEVQTRGKAKWCHFVFDTEDAPEELHRLSAAAGLPKERAVLSFIFAGSVSRKEDTQKPERSASEPEKIRIISDSFPVSGNNPEKKKENLQGRYGCGESGLILVSGNKTLVETSVSGALEELPLVKGLVDAKSGAFVAVKNNP